MFFISRATVLWFACLACTGQTFRRNQPGQPRQSQIEDLGKGIEAGKVLRGLLLASNLDSGVSARVPDPQIGRRRILTPINLNITHARALASLFRQARVPICLGFAAWRSPSCLRILRNACKFSMKLVKIPFSILTHGLHKNMKEVQVMRRMNLFGSFPETVETSNETFLNAIFAELWPKISIFVERVVRNSIEPAIRSALPSAIAGAFHIGDMTLGETPVLSRSIIATPVDYMGSRGPVRHVHIKVNVSYHGTAYIKVHALGTKLGVENVRLDGVLTIALQEPLDDIPFFSGLSIFFVNSPTVSLSWDGAAAFLNFFERHTRNIIKGQINNLCVLPKRISNVMNGSETDLFRITAPRPVGLLRLNLLAARDLKGSKMHIFRNATSDPYTLLRLGRQENRSKTIKKTCDPAWNETCNFLVHNKDQNLYMDIFDAEGNLGHLAHGHLMVDDFLGYATLSVRELLEKCKLGPVWLPLGPDPDFDSQGEVHGEVQLMANWMPFILNSTKAQLIKTAKGAPQALLFVGIYSIQVPPAKVRTEYKVQVSCNNKVFTTKKRSEPRKLQASDEEFRAKIDKLKSFNIPDEDIVEILPIPIEELNEEKPSANSYASSVKVEESWLWLLDVPAHASTQIKIFQGDEMIGSVNLDVANCLQEEMSTKRERLKDGRVEVDVMTQVRVIPDAAATFAEHGELYGF